LSPISPKCPHYFESVMILHGMMLYRINVRRLAPQQVHTFLLKLMFNSLLFAFLANPIRRRKISKKGHWANVDNRKEFLLDFAKKMEFDPMIANNWRTMRMNLKALGVYNLFTFLQSIVLTMLCREVPYCRSIALLNRFFKLHSITCPLKKVI